MLYLPQLSRCDSVHLDKWMGCFYCYKGLLLLFGMYMAWETRHVKIPVLNDSQVSSRTLFNIVLEVLEVLGFSSEIIVLSFSMSSLRISKMT